MEMNGRIYTLNNGKTQEARYNNGTWIVDCPFKCGGAEYYTGKDFTCGACHHEEAYQMQMARQLKGRTTDIARQLARERGEVFKVSRTRFWKEIEDLCRMRPRKNMNWELGESLDHLKLENIEHGII